MKKVIIIRWGELHLKGKNRDYFQNLLEENIKKALKGFEYKFVKIIGRYLIEDFLDLEETSILNKLKKVSGIHTASIATSVTTDLDEITKVAVELSKYKRGTF